MEKETQYIKIAKDIADDINKNYHPGSKLKSEAYYQDKYKVARMTITRSLQFLATNNVIYYVKNKGYYVLPKKDSKGNEILSFSQLCTRLGIKSSSKLLDIELIKPNESIKSSLNLTDDDYVYKISRIRYGDGLPLIIEYAHVVKKFAEGLDKFNFEKYSLYDILKDFYGINIDVQDYVHSAINIEGKEANYLEIENGSAIIKTITTAYMDMGLTPVETTVQYSKWPVTITIKKNNNLNQ